MAASPAAQTPIGGMRSTIQEELRNPTTAFFVPTAPNAPRAPTARAASSLAINPLVAIQANSDLSLRSPTANPAHTVFCTCNRAAGEKCAFCWAWEPSECGSIPSAWSQATSRYASSITGSAAFSKISLTSGISISAQWMQGQRITYAKPDKVPSNTSSRNAVVVVVGVRKEIPQDLWGSVSVRIVRSGEKRDSDGGVASSPEIGSRPPSQSSGSSFKGTRETSLSSVIRTYQPNGIKKGKRIAIKIHGEIPAGEYDVSVGCGGRSLHGSVPLEVYEGESSGKQVESDEESGATGETGKGQSRGSGSVRGRVGLNIENPLFRLLEEPNEE